MKEQQKPLISVRHLAKAYGDVTPLKDVNFEVCSGEVISLIGPSGTGKSTLLRCLNQLETPDSGEIRIFGENLQNPHTDIKKIRERMGMVFQSFNLFSNMTILENIICGPMMLHKVSRQEAEEEALQLLEKVGLSGVEAKWPSQLSGGQKQRAAIARTLAMHPEIILFDEPTSALDPHMVGEVLSVIRDLAGEGITMLIVTHEMHFAKHVSTRVFYIDEGMVYEDGSPEQIFDNPQREKTAEFIRNLQVFRESLDFDQPYDFRQLESRLLAFAKEHFVSRNALTAIQHVTEELLEVILPAQTQKPSGKGSLAFHCTDDGNDCEISLICQDVTEQMLSADELSAQIIRSCCDNIRVENQDDVNQLIFRLKTTELA